MMTRKDYVAVAEIIKSYADEMRRDVVEDLLYDFSDYFASDNPNFDHTRFYNAVFDTVDA